MPRSVTVWPTTFVWGIADVPNVIVTVLAAYLLPLDLVLAGAQRELAGHLVRPIFHLYYTKKRDLRR